MQTWVKVIPILIVSGCSIGVDDSTLCSRTDAQRTQHAAALADDGGPRSVTTGRALIATLDAGCAV